MSALFIILVDLTVTLFREKMLVFTRCICGFMSNLIKKSWKDSTAQVLSWLGFQLKGDCVLFVTSNKEKVNNYPQVGTRDNSALWLKIVTLVHRIRQPISKLRILMFKNCLAILNKFYKSCLFIYYFFPSNTIWLVRKIMNIQKLVAGSFEQYIDKGSKIIFSLLATSFYFLKDNDFNCNNISFMYHLETYFFFSSYFSGLWR